MKIFLVDTQKYYKVTFGEIKRILTSGLTPEQWTKTNIIALNKTK